MRKTVLSTWGWWVEDGVRETPLAHCRGEVGARLSLLQYSHFALAISSRDSLELDRGLEGERLKSVG